LHGDRRNIQPLKSTIQKRDALASIKRSPRYPDVSKILDVAAKYPHQKRFYNSFADVKVTDAQRRSPHLKCRLGDRNQMLAEIGKDKKEVVFSSFFSSKKFHSHLQLLGFLLKINHLLELLNPSFFEAQCQC